MRMIQFISILFLFVVAGLAAPGAPPVEKWPPEDGYAATVLAHHNVHRANHSASALKWSNIMMVNAAVLASTCKWGHNNAIGGGHYGQNIEAGTPGTHVSEAITNSWYNEEMRWYYGQYGKSNPSFKNFDKWGHFSQVVWKRTQFVGCATHNCTERGLHDAVTGLPLKGVAPYFTVCNYYPQGNMGGAYGKNVGRPLGHPTIYANW